MGYCAALFYCEDNSTIYHSSSYIVINPNVNSYLTPSSYHNEVRQRENSRKTDVYISAERERERETEEQKIVVQT